MDQYASARRRSAFVVAAVALAASAFGGAFASRGPVLSPAKQAVIDNAFAPSATAGPAKTPGLRTVAPMTAAEAVAAGGGQITTHEVQAPLPGSLFVPTSESWNVASGIEAAVYGGTDSTTDSGAIYVWRTSTVTGLDQSGTGLFDAAAKGPLTLTAVSGSTVSFVTPQGPGSFDLSADTFGR